MIQIHTLSLILNFADTKFCRLTSLLSSLYCLVPPGEITYAVHFQLIHYMRNVWRPNSKQFQTKSLVVKACNNSSNANLL